MDDYQVIVLDAGATSCKVGISGEDAPRAVFPAVVGRSRMSKIGRSIQQDFYVGQEALDKRGILTIKYPIDHGIVTNWDDIEKIWHYAFYSALAIAPEEHPCLFTEPPLNPHGSREKTTQMMFETFNVPELYLSNRTVLALFATGRATGTVLDSGDGVTHTVPIIEGHALPDATIRLDIGGTVLTDYLIKMLNERGNSFSSINDKDTLRQIKEQLCYVAQDFDEEMNTASQDSSIEKIYELPDGNTITLNNERFRCPEVLFRPSLFEWESNGVHQMVFDSTMRCDGGIQQELFSNIVLSGGNTLFPGFEGRLTKEVQALASEDTNINVIADPSRSYLPWKGGSMFASTFMFQQSSITKAEYDEVGPSIVHQKCT